MTALRWLFKNYKNLSVLFIVMGFINVWAYFQWIGRVDFFPFIIGNVAGSLAILICSMVFFAAISFMFVMPSALCALTGLKSTIKDKKKRSLRDRLEVYYNEGCAAATALVAVITGITVLFLKDNVSMELLYITSLAAFVSHAIFNFIINNKRQKYLRAFIARLQRMHERKNNPGRASSCWFRWERFKANAVVINILYCFISLLIAFVSVAPLYILTGSKIYFASESLLVQYAIVAVLYIFLFMPALIGVFKKKPAQGQDIHPTLALAPAVLIVIFGVFSALLIQINQRGIELVGMSSWQTKVFAFNAAQFPAYYFPEDKWGEARKWDEGNIRLVKGIEVFSNGDVLLVCPSSLKEVRQRALEHNGLLWKTDEKSKLAVNELSQFCLIAKSDQVRTGEALKVLLESLPD